MSSLLLAATSLLVIHHSTTLFTFTRILVVFNQKSSVLQFKPVMSYHIHCGHREQIISVILSAATVYVFEGCYHMSLPGIFSLDQTTLISFHPGFHFCPYDSDHFSCSPIDSAQLPSVFSQVLTQLASCSSSGWGEIPG